MLKVRENIIIFITQMMMSTFIKHTSDSRPNNRRKSTAYPHLTRQAAQKYRSSNYYIIIVAKTRLEQNIK